MSIRGDGAGRGREVISSINEEKNAHTVIDQQIIKIRGKMSKKKNSRHAFCDLPKNGFFFLEKKKLRFYFLITLGND